MATLRDRKRIEKLLDEAEKLLDSSAQTRLGQMKSDPGMRLESSELDAYLRERGVDIDYWTLTPRSGIYMWKNMTRHMLYIGNA